MLTAVVFLLALILLNGLFAMSEIAIVSSRRPRLMQMADGGNEGARHASALAAEPTKFLSSVQIGITTIGILSGAIGEASVAGPVRSLFGHVLFPSRQAETLSLAAMVAALTYVSLTVGELVPKRIALPEPATSSSVAGFGLRSSTWMGTASIASW